MMAMTALNAYERYTGTWILECTFSWINRLNFHTGRIDHCRDNFQAILVNENVCTHSFLCTNSSRLTVVSCAASTTEYACCNNIDVTTAREHFTGTSVIQIQPSETLPSLTVSLWNSTPKLTISKVTINKTILCWSLPDQYCQHQRDLFIFFFLHAVSSKLQSAFQALIASYRL